MEMGVFCVEKGQIWRWESANFVMNQLPKGIKWSVVPLPCSTFLGFHGGKQGSGPDRGQSPVEWGGFSVCPFLSSFLHSGPASQ